ncbi:MAG TPA: FtsX-like permease family protein [Pirellulales bacterium]|nr:FtsX-like permease family protein [Pirellulales bacterium]
MKTPLAWLNLLHDKTRALVAVAGVAFAVVLVLMQLGFYDSAKRTATQVYERLDFDVVMVSKKYLYFSKSGTFPRRRLIQALSDDDVKSVQPLYLGFNLWLNARRGEGNAKPLRRLIFVIGQNLTDDVFKPSDDAHKDVQGKRQRLRPPGNVLMDQLSGAQFGDWKDNDELEIGGRHVHIADTFEMGMGFSADGDVIVGSETFQRLFPYRSLNEVSLGLVKLKSPDKAAQVVARLRRLLQRDEGQGPPPEDVDLRKLPTDDVEVFTRADIDAKDRDHWINKTSVGVIFELGVAVGFIVGTAIVYQVLSSDIANHIREYATLKAMGYSRGYLALVVLKQAWILALVGFVPGWILSWGLYTITSKVAHIQMVLTWPLSLGVWAMTFVMCSLSGLAALRKVTSADPADLF